MYILIELESNFVVGYIGPFDTEEDAMGYGKANCEDFEVYHLTLP